MPLYNESTLKELRELTPEYLETICSGINLRRPFRCLHPLHEDIHPSMSFDRRTNRVRCFSCGTSGDVFELAGWVEGVSSFPEKVKAVAHAVGYSLRTHSQTKKTKPAKPLWKPAYDKPRPLANFDFTNEIQQAARALMEEPQGKAALDYLHERGFSDELISDSCLGWVEHPSVMFPEMRAPRCDEGYIVLGFPSLLEKPSMQTKDVQYSNTIPYAVFRMCETEAKCKELKPMGITSSLWREHLLTGTHNQDEPIYVTEGIFDAMSLTALFGVQACAICGGSGTTRLLQVIANTSKGKRPKLVLAFDSDETGRAYTEKVSKGLRQLGAHHLIAPRYPYGCNDANELLMLERRRHG